MQHQNLPFSKTLNPNPPFPKTLTSHSFRLLPSRPPNSPFPSSLSLLSSCAAGDRDLRAFAGRSKKKPGDQSSGRIEGDANLRRDAKRNARRKSKELAESLFYRLNNPGKNYADNFSEDELQAIGLGYDRMVRFMEKDDPNLRHPYDWYKYGEFGPYSWRGIVVGNPVRGRFTDERASIYGEVKDHEEWEKIEQFEMAADFNNRLKSMDANVGFKYFWVFVRHPKWRLNELPWEQWTLVAEVVVEADKKQRLDKWSLMGRLGNKSRQMITQCAAWMRPDIIYVKKPVFQCRFEPQDDFFRALTTYLDPKTEQNYLCELRDEVGNVEMCTYFAGLCKIVKVNPKAFVDDVVKGYEKLSDEGKNRCLEFLFTNHPLPLLHPYTKEWKNKLEEMELGCDAPDDDEEDSLHRKKKGDVEFTDWIEEDGEEEEEAEEDVALVMEGGGDEEIAGEEEDVALDMEGDAGEEESAGEEEDEDAGEEEKEGEQYWEQELRKAIGSSERMEVLARRSVKLTTELYEKQLGDGEKTMPDGDELSMRGKRKGKLSPEEWKYVGIGRWRKRIKKSRIPPEVFLRSVVRPFTYRNLVKEIVLTRHAILEGEIGRKE